MRTIYASIALILGLSHAAFAAESDGASPYDTNPKCAERTSNGAGPECVLPAEGTPRQVHPPARHVTPAPPGPKPPAVVTSPTTTRREVPPAGGGVTR